MKITKWILIGFTAAILIFLLAEFAKRRKIAKNTEASIEATETTVISKLISDLPDEVIADTRPPVSGGTPIELGSPQGFGSDEPDVFIGVRR